MEDGKRLENLSWRLWNRETFCCAPSPKKTASRALTRTKETADAPAACVPELSSSLESASSEEEFETSSPVAPRIASARPEIRRHDSVETSRSRGHEKHITPIDLEKIVISIKETKQLEPIELPRPLMEQSATTDSLKLTSSQSPRQSPSSQASQGLTSHPSISQATLLESSASTVGTHGSHDSQVSESSQMVGSQDSSSTEMSTHSIIRGFVPGGAPSSYRSQTNLAAQPTPILKTSPSYRNPPPKQKKGAMFTIGTSSGEDESSLESHMFRSNISESLRHPSSFNSNGSKKRAAFTDNVSVTKATEYSSVFGSDDEDEDVSESAIEDDDDSSDWEDSEDQQSGPSSVNERELFQRVDSRPNLTSRRSLLTSLMHEPDRARALANAASRSTPALRRSRVTTPNGPSVATSPMPTPLPEPSTHLQIPSHNMTRSKPIIMTTSNTHQQLALSPRTTRRNMLSTELTESLRKNLLWERQHKSTGNLAAMKRRHTSNDVKNLRQHPEPGPVLDQKPKGFTNDYFHAGLGEYHAKGW